MSLTLSLSIHSPYEKKLKMFVNTCHPNTRVGHRQTQVHPNQPSKLPESQDNEKYWFKQTNKQQQRCETTEE